MNAFWFIFTYILVVIAPIIFWLLLFRKLDRNEPEPKKLLFKIFILGFIAVVVALILETIFDSLLLPENVQQIYLESGDIAQSAFLLLLVSFFLAGPIEELVKYLFLKGAVYKSPYFNQIADGIIYGVTLALGFAFVENTGYFFDVYFNLSTTEFIFIVAFRGIVTTLLHISTAGILGLYLGRAKFQTGRVGTALKGLLIASLIHGLFNVFIFSPYGVLINFFMVALVMVYLIYQIKTKETQAIWDTRIIKKKLKG